MMSLKRIFGLMLLFLFFEAVVAVVTVIFFSPAYVLQACGAMTALAVLTWISFVGLTRLLARQKKVKPEAAKSFVPAAVKPVQEDDSFTLEFTGLMQEANRRLAALGVESGKAAPTVQTMPLYLLVGSDGSGKTSALLQSGLEPRLLAGEAQRDGSVTPTALANFWYAGDALFVELAGRIVMREPENWEKALRLLSAQPQQSRWQRWFAPRVAVSQLRGVLLVCDTGMLLQSRDAHRLGSLSRTLNERLRSVQTLMRTDFPVYALFTRCDSVQYFQEFFAQLTEAEARRVVGVTLPVMQTGSEYADVYVERESSKLNKHLNRLYQSLADKRVLLLAREEATDRRAQAFEFPREFKKVRGELVQFLLDVFRPSTLAAPCRLRGFYFCGQRLVARNQVDPSLQDLTSFDSSLDFTALRGRSDATAFLGSTRHSSTSDFSVVRKPAKDTRIAKQTFLEEFFRRILLADPAAKVVAAAPRAYDFGRINVALGVCGALCLLLSVISVFAWQWNVRLLADVKAAVLLTTSRAGISAGDALGQLDALRPVATTLDEYRREGAPLRMRWGMYAGNRTVDDVDSLYWTGFRNVVLDPAVYTLSRRFLALRSDAPANDDVYSELKGYRTVTSGKCKPDSALVAGTVLTAWRESAARDEPTEALAAKQIAFYAEQLPRGNPYGPGLPENADAVAHAQIYLQTLAGPSKLLQALLNQERTKAAEALSGYASNYHEVLSGPDQVEGPYTSTGWREVESNIRDHKLTASGEPCVLGKEAGSSGWTGGTEMEAQVQTLYSDTYLQAWKQYLQSHHVVAFTSTQDAAQKLRVLADNNRSPLLALLYMTSANTNVSASQSLRDSAAANLQKVTTTAVGTVKGLAGKYGLGAKDGAVMPIASVAEVPMTVSNAFAPVHAMVDPGDAQKWLNERNTPYMKALGDLSDAMQTLPAQVHNEVPLETQELQGAKTALLAADAALHSLAGAFPNTRSGVDVDLQNLLREPLDQARRTIQSVAIVKTPPMAPGGAPGPGAAPPPVDPAAAAKIKGTIRQINVAALGICSSTSSLSKKFPFDASGTPDVTLDELNALLQPGTGVYPQFTNNPDVQRGYLHTGRVWAAKQEFPATYSQPFVGTLNSLAETEEELYGGGSASPHLDLTLTVDGTGKIPFELDVDGHTIKFTPGKPAPPLRLVWPPVTNSPTRLVLKTGGKGGNTLPAEYPGAWGLFHLLQAADDQNGNVFTFRSVRFANSLMPLTNDKGGAATVQIRIDSAGSNLFNRGYFAKLRCSDTWALQPQSPAN